MYLSCIGAFVTFSDLLNPDSLMNNLYPHDLGEDSPNFANAFMLSKAG